MTNRPSRFVFMRLALLCALIALALPLAAKAQNLAMRRLIDEAKKTDVAACEATIKDKVGVTIPVEVDFASLGDDQNRMLSLKDLLQGISDGVSAEAKDKAGKDALAAKVKKIVLTRDENGYAVSFKDGVLTCKASFVSNFANSMEDKVKATLEESL